MYKQSYSLILLVSIINSSLLGMDSVIPPEMKQIQEAFQVFHNPKSSDDQVANAVIGLAIHESPITKSAAQGVLLGMLTMGSGKEIIEKIIQKVPSLKTDWVFKTTLPFHLPFDAIKPQLLLYFESQFKRQKGDLFFIGSENALITTNDANELLKLFTNGDNIDEPMAKSEVNQKTTTYYDVKKVLATIHKHYEGQTENTQWFASKLPKAAAIIKQHLMDIESGKKSLYDFSPIDDKKLWCINEEEIDDSPCELSPRKS